MTYIILAFLTGCAVILSLVINSKLAEKIGIFQGSLVNYTVGLLFSTLVLIFNYRHINMAIELFIDIPFWVYLGGFIGVIVLSINNIVIPKIPTIYSTLLLFIGQLSMGMLIDFVIGNTISMGKIAGGLLILSGMLYNFYVDKKASDNIIIDE
ncbi:MAG: DMT family transporter [Maledivibacter sp.]|nr:DMT family transporter [Maledivibacter sp.]